MTDVQRQVADAMLRLGADNVRLAKMERAHRQLGSDIDRLRADVRVRTVEAMVADDGLTPAAP